MTPPTPRPDRSRQLFGYVPGNYDFKCILCGEIKTGGDKRCAQCFECALKQGGFPPEVVEVDARRPQIGDTISMRGSRPAIVCAPDDPRRTGYCDSTIYGKIPIIIDTRNRKQRRADAAKR